METLTTILGTQQLAALVFWWKLKIFLPQTSCLFCSDDLRLWREKTFLFCKHARSLKDERIGAPDRGLSGVWKQLHGSVVLHVA